ncbi:MAG TPA: hypothetical protein VE591_08710 [Candidatus Acidoferrum sp.]|nr:hypothetical protein [Candidatus Acidoferrum sp.]
MNRINYLVSRWERLPGVTRAPSVATALRGPLVALFGSLALVGALHGLQEERLQSLAHDGDTASARLAATQITLHRVAVLESDVARLRMLCEHVDVLRRSGAERASEIAAIGNRIPAEASLSAVRLDHEGYALEGYGARLAVVGATMAALGNLPAASGARLLSVQDDAARHGVTYAIAVEIKR